jgi:hypothetical protein
MSRIGGAAGRTAFGPPIHDRESAASKASAVRMCDEPGCATVLSRYNNETACWLHARPTFITRSAGRHGA